MKKKRFKSYLRNTAIVICVLLTMTNCKQEEIQIQITTENKHLFTIPEITVAKKSFENSNNNTNIFNKTNLGLKENKKKFFIAWDNSSVVQFNKNQGIDILYTPIIYDKKGNRNKSFVASLTNKKNKTESYIYSLFYDNYSTTEYFSGIIVKFDTKGSLMEILEYDKGLRSKKYSLKKNSTKTNYSAKSDDCEWTLEDILEAIEFMMESGINEINMLDCVWIDTGWNVYTHEELEFMVRDIGSWPSWDEVPIQVMVDYPVIFGGGGGLPNYTPVEPTPEPVDEEFFWTEEEEETIILLNNLLNITENPDLLAWAMDPVNFELVKLLNQFLGEYPTEEKEAFAYLAIEAYMNGKDVNFNQFYTTQIINNLENPITGKPIEFYMLAQYNNSITLDLSLYSISSNEIKVGEYFLKPHYGVGDKLVFYSAYRVDDNGNLLMDIEYIIKADALKDFQNNINLYTYAANLFYTGGIPSQDQIAMAAGDYWVGLRSMWYDALHSEEWWAYTILCFGHAIVNLPVNTTINSTRTVANWKVPLNKMTAKSFQGKVVTNPQGVKVTIDIPDNYVPSLANNGQGINFRPFGSNTDANLIRVMQPNFQNPNGYARFYNQYSQPMNNPSVNTNPGSNANTHFSF